MSDDAAARATEIAAELMHELRRSSVAEVEVDARTLRELEMLAGVALGVPEAAGSHSGAGRRFVRGWARRLTRWYVEPFVVQQRAFNIAAVRHIAALERRIEDLEADREARRS